MADYDRTMNQAREIDELNNELIRIANNITTMVQEAEVHWRGDAAHEYFSQSIKFQDCIRNTVTEMSQISDSIRQAALTCPEEPIVMI